MATDLRCASKSSVTYLYQSCSAEADVPVPLEKAWALWEDRESIPKVDCSTLAAHPDIVSQLTS
jgi:hypothetical protein